MSNKFLTTSSGSINLSNGTVDIFAESLGADNLEASRPLRTNAVKKIVSSNLDISDINNLPVELTTKQELTFVNNDAHSNPPSGQTKLYVKSDGTFYKLDENGNEQNIGGITNPYVGTWIVSDLETDDTFSLNQEIQKISNISSATNAPNPVVTDFDGEIHVAKIKSASHNTEIEFEQTGDMTLTTDGIINITSVGDTNITTVDNDIQMTASEIRLNSSTLTANGSNIITNNINPIAIGISAGLNDQGINSVAIGYRAGINSQSENSISIGLRAGENTQGINAVAIGNSAGSTNQGDGGIAIGTSAGQNTQNPGAVAIGVNAGRSIQGADAIAIGYRAGINSQSENSISIGKDAGHQSQGESSVAIGQLAGQTNQHANSIILNASGTALNSSTSSSFYAKPIRNENNSKVLLYNETDGEITYYEPAFRKIKLLDTDETDYPLESGQMIRNGTRIEYYTPFTNTTEEIAYKSDFETDIATNTNDIENLKWERIDLIPDVNKYIRPTTLAGAYRREEEERFIIRCSNSNSNSAIGGYYDPSSVFTRKRFNDVYDTEDTYMDVWFTTGYDGTAPSLALNHNGQIFNSNAADKNYFRDLRASAGYADTGTVNGVPNTPLQEAKFEAISIEVNTNSLTGGCVQGSWQVQKIRIASRLKSGAVGWPKKFEIFIRLMDSYINQSTVGGAGWVRTHLFLDSTSDWTNDYYLDIDLPSTLDIEINNATHTIQPPYAINGFCMCVQETAGNYASLWIDDISFFCEAGRRDKYVI